jgi:tetratricopeptide (TPR) repeat protein
LVELRPDDASAHYGFGLVLQALEHAEEARAQYERSIELQPLQTEAYFQLGLIDLDEKKLDEASGRFNHVLQRNSKHAGAWFGAGRVEFEKKQYEKAIENLQRALAINSSLRQAHYYLGLAYARTGKKEDSEKELGIASQLEHEELERHRGVLRILNLDLSPEAVEAKP